MPRRGARIPRIDPDLNRDLCSLNIPRYLAHSRGSNITEVATVMTAQENLTVQAVSIVVPVYQGEFTLYSNWKTMF